MKGIPSQFQKPVVLIFNLSGRLFIQDSLFIGRQRCVQVSYFYVKLFLYFEIG